MWTLGVNLGCKSSGGGLLAVCKDNFPGEGGEVRKGHRYKAVSRERERRRGSPGTHSVCY